MSKLPSLRRIQADIRELAIDPSDQYHAAPLETDMFEWHFTIRGADGTDFEGGVYHGRILLPADYPFKPPNIVFLTPSGRFETNTKVCLSFSAYHPELWQPAWGIRLILEALISFLPTKGDGAIGALDWTSEERKRLAKNSINFVCSQCGNCALILKNLELFVKRKKKLGGGVEENLTSHRFQEEIAKLHALQVATEIGFQMNDGLNDNKKEDNNKKEREMKFDGTNSAPTETDTRKEKGETKEDCDEIYFPKELTESKANFATKKDVEEKEMNSSLLSGDRSQNSTIYNGNNAVLSFRSSATFSDSTENTLTIERQLVDKAENTIGAEDGQAGIKGKQTDIPVEQHTEEHDMLGSPWFSDSFLNGAIVILAISLYLLYQRLYDLIDNLKELEKEFQNI